MELEHEIPYVIDRGVKSELGACDILIAFGDIRCTITLKSIYPIGMPPGPGSEIGCGIHIITPSCAFSSRAFTATLRLEDLYRLAIAMKSPSDDSLNTHRVNPISVKTIDMGEVDGFGFSFFWTDDEHVEATIHAAYPWRDVECETGAFSAGDPHSSRGGDYYDGYSCKAITDADDLIAPSQAVLRIIETIKEHYGGIGFPKPSLRF